MATVVAQQASVHRRAVLGDDVWIGPFCVVGPQVVVGDGTRLENNVTLMGRVTLGRDNRLYPGAVIGGEPQDLSYRGGDTAVHIGHRNVIREGVTVNRASEKEDGLTQLGDDCYLMACSHIAHDCKLGDRVIIANGTLLGGHVHVHHDASISGNVGVHHFVSIGAYSFVGGMSRVPADVPPYMLVEGSPSRPRCVNVVGLRRRGFRQEVIEALVVAHRLLFREQAGLDRTRELLRERELMLPAVNHLLSFLEQQQEGRHGRGRERRRAA